MSNRPALPRIDIEGVAARLEALRETTGLTRDNFAKSFGYDPSSYTKTANGTKPLKAEHAFACAEIWGVTMDYLFRGDMSRIDSSLQSKLIKNLTNRTE